MLGDTLYNTRYKHDNLINHVKIGIIRGEIQRSINNGCNASCYDLNSLFIVNHQRMSPLSPVEYNVLKRWGRKHGLVININSSGDYVFIHPMNKFFRFCLRVFNAITQ